MKNEESVEIMTSELTKNTLEYLELLDKNFSETNDLIKCLLVIEDKIDSDFDSISKKMNLSVGRTDEHGIKKAKLFMLAQIFTEATVSGVAKDFGSNMNPPIFSQN